MRPLAREYFRLHTPAGDVGDREHGLQVGGQPFQDRVEIAALEEAGAGIVFLEHVDEGASENLTRSLTEAEHALERGEFAVDGGIRRLLFLPVPDIGKDPIRRDCLCAPSGEEPLEVVDGVFDTINGLPGIGPVLIHQERDEGVEARLVGIGHVGTLADLGFPVLQLFARDGS